MNPTEKQIINKIFFNIAIKLEANSWTCWNKLTLPAPHNQIPSNHTEHDKIRPHILQVKTSLRNWEFRHDCLRFSLLNTWSYTWNSSNLPDVFVMRIRNREYCVTSLFDNKITFKNIKARAMIAPGAVTSTLTALFPSIICNRKLAQRGSNSQLLKSINPTTQFFILNIEIA